MEYTELQQKGHEIAKQHENLPLQEKLDIIARTFGCETARIETSPCFGKYRGNSDMSIVFDNGASLFCLMCRTPQAKTTAMKNVVVNAAMAHYHPEIVSEAKSRAAAAISKREAEDNAIAAEKELKPYKFLNVELNCGGLDDRSNSYMGWYYVTLAVDGNIFGFLETGLKYGIADGNLSEHITRPEYFVAGGMRDEEVDFVFNNVGHSSFNGSHQIRLSAAALERAERRLSERQIIVEDDFSRPDPTVIAEEMLDYGYVRGDMHPLSGGRALELFDSGHTIYLLYPDDTEALANDREEIITFGNKGYCGITKADWEHSGVHMARPAAAIQSEPEDERGMEI